MNMDINDYLILDEENLNSMPWIILVYTDFNTPGVKLANSTVLKL